MSDKRSFNQLQFNFFLLGVLALLGCVTVGLDHDRVSLGDQGWVVLTYETLTWVLGLCSAVLFSLSALIHLRS